MCLDNQNTRRFIIRIRVRVRARGLSYEELSIRSPMKVQHKSRYQCDRYAVGMNRLKGCTTGMRRGLSYLFANVDKLNRKNGFESRKLADCGKGETRIHTSPN